MLLEASNTISFQLYFVFLMRLRKASDFHHVSTGILYGRYF